MTNLNCGHKGVKKALAVAPFRCCQESLKNKNKQANIQNKAKTHGRKGTPGTRNNHLAILVQGSYERGENCIVIYE